MRNAKAGLQQTSDFRALLAVMSDLFQLMKPSTLVDTAGAIYKI